MSDLNECQQEAVEQAEAQGLTVVRSSPSILLIDLDDGEAIHVLNADVIKNVSGVVNRVLCSINS